MTRNNIQWVHGHNKGKSKVNMPQKPKERGKCPMANMAGNDS